MPIDQAQLNALLAMLGTQSPNSFTGGEWEGSGAGQGESSLTGVGSGAGITSSTNTGSPQSAAEANQYYGNAYAGLQAAMAGLAGVNAGGAPTMSAEALAALGGGLGPNDPTQLPPDAIAGLLAALGVTNAMGPGGIGVSGGAMIEDVPPLDPAELAALNAANAGMFGMGLGGNDPLQQNGPAPAGSNNAPGGGGYYQAQNGQILSPGQAAALGTLGIGGLGGGSGATGGSDWPGNILGGQGSGAGSTPGTGQGSGGGSTGGGGTGGGGGGGRAAGSWLSNLENAWANATGANAGLFNSAGGFGYTRNMIDDGGAGQFLAGTGGAGGFSGGLSGLIQNLASGNTEALQRPDSQAALRSLVDALGEINGPAGGTGTGGTGTGTGGSGTPSGPASQLLDLARQFLVDPATGTAPGFQTPPTGTQTGNTTGTGTAPPSGTPAPPPGTGAGSNYADIIRQFLEAQQGGSGGTGGLPPGINPLPTGGDTPSIEDILNALQPNYGADRGSSLPPGTGAGTGGTGTGGGQGGPPLVDTSAENDPIRDALAGLLGQDTADALAGANAANEQRYQDILGGYVNREGQALDLSNFVGNRQLRDLYDLYGVPGSAEGGQVGAKVDQDLLNRGLGNTTVRSSAQLGVQRNRDRASLDLADQIAAQRLGILGDFTGDTLDFAERRTDAAPDVMQIAELLRGLGGAGPATGTPGAFAPGTGATGGTGGNFTSTGGGQNTTANMSAAGGNLANDMIGGVPVSPLRGGPQVGPPPGGGVGANGGLYNAQGVYVGGAAGEAPQNVTATMQGQGSSLGSGIGAPPPVGAQTQATMAAESQPAPPAPQSSGKGLSTPNPLAFGIGATPLGDIGRARQQADSRVWDSGGFDNTAGFDPASLPTRVPQTQPADQNRAIQERADAFVAATGGGSNADRERVMQVLAAGKEGAPDPRAVGTGGERPATGPWVGEAMNPGQSQGNLRSTWGLSAMDRAALRGMDTSSPEAQALITEAMAGNAPPTISNLMAQLGGDPIDPSTPEFRNFGGQQAATPQATQTRTAAPPSAPGSPSPNVPPEIRQQLIDPVQPRDPSGGWDALLADNPNSPLAQSLLAARRESGLYTPDGMTLLGQQGPAAPATVRPYEGLQPGTAFWTDANGVRHDFTDYTQTAPPSAQQRGAMDPTRPPAPTPLVQGAGIPVAAGRPAPPEHRNIVPGTPEYGGVNFRGLPAPGANQGVSSGGIPFGNDMIGPGHPIWERIMGGRNLDGTPLGTGGGFLPGPNVPDDPVAGGNWNDPSHPMYGINSGRNPDGTPLGTGGGLLPGPSVNVPQPGAQTPPSPPQLPPATPVGSPKVPMTGVPPWALPGGQHPGSPGPGSMPMPQQPSGVNPATINPPIPYPGQSGGVNPTIFPPQSGGTNPSGGGMPPMPSGVNPATINPPIGQPQGKFTGPQTSQPPYGMNPSPVNVPRNPTTPQQTGMPPGITPPAQAPTSPAITPPSSVGRPSTAQPSGVNPATIYPPMPNTPQPLGMGGPPTQVGGPNVSVQGGQSGSVYRQPTRVQQPMQPQRPMPNTPSRISILTGGGTW